MASLIHFFRVLSFILFHKLWNKTHNHLNAWLHHAFVKHPHSDKSKLSDLAGLFYSINLESKQALKLIHVNHDAFWVLKTKKALKAIENSKLLKDKKENIKIGKILIKLGS